MTSFDPSAALHKLGRINDLRPISVFDFCHLLRSAPFPYNPCFAAAAATAFLCLSFRLTTPSLSALNRGEAGTNRYPERRQLQPLPQHRSIGTEGEERRGEGIRTPKGLPGEGAPCCLRRRKPALSPRPGARGKSWFCSVLLYFCASGGGERAREYLCPISS